MLLCHLPACSGACCNILLSSGIRFSQAHSLLTAQGAATFAVGCIGTDLVPFVCLSSSFVVSSLLFLLFSFPVRADPLFKFPLFIFFPWRSYFFPLSGDVQLSVFLLSHCLLSTQGGAIFAVGCSCPDLLPFVWISSSSFVVSFLRLFFLSSQLQSLLQVSFFLLFFFFFCLEFVCFDAIIADLQSQLQSLDASLSDASDKLTLADQEKVRFL
ncbi:unnamed protein product [Coffea canephora]|uniref:Uncharacterized protein n=1 Tax=Coffea canephora TaxID=49390 RepID=A0A068UHX9_COFCA|nr:unnamed protein product [Coffea canephora]